MLTKLLCKIFGHDRLEFRDRTRHCIKCNTSWDQNNNKILDYKYPYTGANETGE